MWRKTPQTTLISKLLAEAGHATNKELAAKARQVFPSITNTTVHRITTRLVDAKMAADAPSLQNARVIDANVKPHDHFICQGCGSVVDIDLSNELFNALQKQLPGKLSRRSVLVAGTCEACLVGKKN